MKSFSFPFYLLLVLSLRGQESSLSESQVKKGLSAVVSVTAEFDQVDLRKTPNHVRVLTQADIERYGAKTLGELLVSAVPGQVLSTGGPGSAATLRIGGSRPEDVTVLLNGIRINDAAGLGFVNPNSISLVGVKRIEIIESNASTLVGSGAMGGVIALYTDGNPLENEKNSFDLAIGNQAYQNLRSSLRTQWSGGWLRSSIDANREALPTPTAQNYRSIGTQLGLGQVVGDHAFYLDYRNFYQGVPIPYVRVELGPSARPSSDYDASRNFKLRNEQLSLRYETILPNSIPLSLYFGSSSQSRLEPKYDNSGYDPYESRRTEGGLKARWQPSTDLSFAYRLELFQEQAKTPAYPSGEDRGSASHLSNAIESHWQASEAFRFLVTLREDRDKQSFTTASSGFNIESLSSRARTWRFGVTYLPVEKWIGQDEKWFISLGTGFNLAPLTSSLYHAQNMLDPNSYGYDPTRYSKLDKEEGSFVHVGYETHWDRYDLQFKLSRLLHRNLVYFDLNSYDYANGQNLRIQSAEMIVTYRGDGWNARGSYRNQEARQLDAPEAQQLITSASIRRPFNILSLGIDRQWKEVRANLQWSYSGSHYDNFGGFPARLGSYRHPFQHLNIGLYWSQSSSLEVSLRGQHLLQPRVTLQDWLSRKYDFTNNAQQLYGFPAQAPIVSLGVKYLF